MAINTVTIAGNLTRDPDMRSTQTGLTVMGFTVAVNDKTKNASTGQYEDDASFFNCVMFGKYADSMSTYLKKGSKVTVQGKLKQDRWQDQDGNNRTSVKIIVNQMELMFVPKTMQQTAQTTQATPLADDDIPF